MKISIVMGIAGAGKSTYIKEHFEDIKVIDLFDFQEDINLFSTDDIMKSYEACRDALIEEIKKGNDVVLEHTLLKAKRRKMYIDAIREVTDAPIECILIYPKKEELKRRKIKRNIFSCDEHIDAEISTLEIPKVEEGFSNVDIVIDSLMKDN